MAAQSFFSYLYIFLFVAFAHCLPREVELQSLESRQACEHGPTSRQCWGEYSIDTDYYTTFPDTGVTRQYYLVVQNITISPDGYDRLALVVNGTMPGPTIEANWGDTLEITVKNELNDGTAIHWHGIRHLNSVMEDGVPGVTQCPIPPGEEMVYKFKATQYGSGWYHSHFSLQLGEGLLGPVVIHGPATANYDIDMGPVVIQDWGHVSAFTIWRDHTRPDQQRKLALIQPSLDNGLINGENVFDCSKSKDPACTGNGKRTEMVFEPGKKYRLRLVGAQIDGYFKFSIDNHKFKVIANDFVPIVPYETTDLLIVSGQRYDIIVEANQPTGNYWMRAIYQTACNQNNNKSKDNIRGVIRYVGAATGVDPTTNQYSSITNSCGDEPYNKLVPWVKKNVGKNVHQGNLPIRWYYEWDLVFHWTFGPNTMMVNWSDPSISQLYHGDNQFVGVENVVRVPQVNQWTYWVITDQTLVNVYHPMHLHGHDVYVLAQGRGIFNPITVKLNTVNPPRRDTVSIEGTGYLVLAFLSDNPGAWLFHCHIAWHASQGLSMQYIERESEIPGLFDATTATAMNDQCAKWRTWYQTHGHEMDDSGI